MQVFLHKTVVYNFIPLPYNAARHMPARNKFAAQSASAYPARGAWLATIRYFCLSVLRLLAGSDRLLQIVEDIVDRLRTDGQAQQLRSNPGRNLLFV